MRAIMLLVVAIVIAVGGYSAASRSVADSNVQNVISARQAAIAAIN